MNAKRVKAITPLCVGVGATCASFTLLTPTIVDALNVGNSVIMITKLYIICPLVGVLAAAVANLALEETNDSRRAQSMEAYGGSPMTQCVSGSKTDRWRSFAGSVLLASIIGGVV